MFTVEEKYINAIENFSFIELEQGSIEDLSSSALDKIIKEIALKILTASNMQSMFSRMAERTLSLHETCYLIVQSTDQKTGQDTPARIKSISDKAKSILSHVVKELPKEFPPSFVQLPSKDLGAFALLFGVHSICDLANDCMIPTPVQLSRIEEIEATLTQLIKLRKQYPEVLSADMSEISRNFIQDVDAKIKESKELLAVLKENSKIEQKKA